MDHSEEHCEIGSYVLVVSALGSAQNQYSGFCSWHVNASDACAAQDGPNMAHSHSYKAVW